MHNTIENYKVLVNNIGELINVSGYRNDFIAKKIGIKATTFSVKKQRSTWTVEDVEKIMKIIDNEEVDDYLLGLQMQSLENEDIISLDDFKKQSWL